MTEVQVISIKKYCEAIYPMMKNDSDGDSDLVWYDQLKDEEYHGTMQALKNWIKKGNKFPPSIPELIFGYDYAVLEHQAEVIRMMDYDKYFDDPKGTDEEIAAFNKKNRIRRAKMYCSIDYPKERIPEWFKKDYLKYDERLKAEYIKISLQQKSAGLLS
jgi:hypothetical protein